MVVYTSACDVLLLKRSQPFEFWQSVTGSLRSGESHAAAAARELKEETGLTGEGDLAYTGVSRQFAIDPRWRHRFPPGTVENVEYEYRYCLAESTAVQLSDNEHSDSQWLPIDDAIECVWSWTNEAALKSLQVTL